MLSNVPKHDERSGFDFILDIKVMMKALATYKVKAVIPAIVFFILMAPLYSFSRDMPGASVSDDDLLEEIGRRHAHPAPRAARV